MASTFPSDRTLPVVPLQEQDGAHMYLDSMTSTEFLRKFATNHANHFEHASIMSLVCGSDVYPKPNASQDHFSVWPSIGYSMGLPSGESYVRDCVQKFLTRVQCVQKTKDENSRHLVIIDAPLDKLDFLKADQHGVGMVSLVNHPFVVELMSNAENNKTTVFVVSSAMNTSTGLKTRTRIGPVGIAHHAKHAYFGVESCSTGTMSFYDANLKTELLPPKPQQASSSTPIGAPTQTILANFFQKQKQADAEELEKKKAFEAYCYRPPIGFELKDGTFVRKECVKNEQTGWCSLGHQLVDGLCVKKEEEVLVCPRGTEAKNGLCLLKQVPKVVETKNEEIVASAPTITPVVEAKKEEAVVSTSVVKPIDNKETRALLYNKKVDEMVARGLQETSVKCYELSASGNKYAHFVLGITEMIAKLVVRIKYPTLESIPATAVVDVKDTFTLEQLISSASSSAKREEPTGTSSQIAVATPVAASSSSVSFINHANVAPPPAPSVVAPASIAKKAFSVKDLMEEDDAKVRALAKKYFASCEAVMVGEYNDVTDGNYVACIGPNTEGEAGPKRRHRAAIKTTVEKLRRMGFIRVSHDTRGPISGHSYIYFALNLAE